MDRKPKHSKETKLLAIQQYNKGNKSIGQLSEELDVAITTIKRWIGNYDSIGASSLSYNPRNNSYTSEFKLKVIHFYINGEGS